MLLPITSPVGLKEAALDSPTFRATAVHFADQVEAVEKWLENYVKATGKLVHEVSGTSPILRSTVVLHISDFKRLIESSCIALEELVNAHLSKLSPPLNISEAVLDHDYSLLALKRYGDGTRDFWSQTIVAMKKMESTMMHPIRSFVHGELRNFKVRSFEHSRYLCPDLTSAHYRIARDTLSRRNGFSIPCLRAVLHSRRRGSLQRCARMPFIFTKRAKRTSKPPWIFVSWRLNCGHRSINCW